MKCNLYYVLYYFNALHVSGGPSAHHEEPIKLGIVMLFCYLPLVFSLRCLQQRKLNGSNTCTPTVDSRKA